MILDHNTLKLPPIQKMANDLIFGEIKSVAFLKIERLALDNEGMLFGGAVRDFMISQHYSTMYVKHLKSKKERFNVKAFWDVNNHPETAARTLVPDDMDVFFEEKDNASAFVESLCDICNREGVSVEIETVTDNISKMPKEYGNMLSIQKISITIVAGKIPFVCDGHNIIVNIDVVTPCYPIMMLPPFNNLDFLCNGFIKTKHGIMYSMYTNTYLDNLSEIDKAAEIIKIQKDMLKFQTHLCKFETIKENDLSTFGKNRTGFRRISKLLRKEYFPWTICNLPFESRQAAESDTENLCCICASHIHTHDQILITTSDTMSHKLCLLHHMEKQCDEADLSYGNNDQFAFKCLSGSTIDFTKCPLYYRD